MGSEPPHRRMAQGRKDYPTHARHSVVILRNTHTTARIEIIAGIYFRYDCLYILSYGGHTLAGSYYSRHVSKKKNARVTSYTSRERREHLIKGGKAQKRILWLEMNYYYNKRGTLVSVAFIIGEMTPRVRQNDFISLLDLVNYRFYYCYLSTLGHCASTCAHYDEE